MIVMITQRIRIEIILVTGEDEAEREGMKIIETNDQAETKVQIIHHEEAHLMIRTIQMIIGRQRN